MRVTAEMLEPLNERFEGAPPASLLAFVWGVFGRRAALLSGMQPAGTMLCHMADRAGLTLDVLFVDTGLMHEQTLAVRDELARTHARLRVVTLVPAKSFAEQTRDEGLLYLSKQGQERCCELRKQEPLRAVRGNYDALIAALRQEEGGPRARVRPFGLDAEMNALRVHPLARQSAADVDAYLAANPDALCNPLHAMGFPSIGCFPCTTPVRPDEPLRAGRWRHLADVAYCGINPIDRGEKIAIELDDDVASRLLGAA